MMREPLPCLEVLVDDRTYRNAFRVVFVRTTTDEQGNRNICVKSTSIPFTRAAEPEAAAVIAIAELSTVVVPLMADDAEIAHAKAESQKE